MINTKSSVFSANNVAEALRYGVGMLGDGNGQQTPRRLCELLLCALLDCRVLDILAQPQKKLAAGVWTDYCAGLRRLAAGEPLQYVTGNTFFMERVFSTDPRALIPRPETETLVLTLLARNEVWDRIPPPVILDLGTGSGCIAVTLALERPEAVYLACDCSTGALELARGNANAHGVEHRITFLHVDDLALEGYGMLDALIANPPYVATPEYRRLPRCIRDYEPRKALDGGPDGLEVVEKFIRRAADLLRPGGWLFMEIGHGQSAAVCRRLRLAGFIDPSPARDFYGKERVVQARFQP